MDEKIQWRDFIWIVYIIFNNIIITFKLSFKLNKIVLYINWTQLSPIRLILKIIRKKNKIKKMDLNTLLNQEHIYRSKNEVNFFPTKFLIHKEKKKKIWGPSYTNTQCYFWSISLPFTRIGKNKKHYKSNEQDDLLSGDVIVRARQRFYWLSIYNLAVKLRLI